MNELNYATREASQRLFDAGIVLATEKVWATMPDPVHRGKLGKSVTQIIYPPLYPYKEQIPAPCFAEVWRELPKNSGEMIKLMRDFYGDNVSTEFLFRRLFDIAYNVDFAVTLLIWVTEKKRKER